MVQNDIYYNLNDNTDPQYIFKDGFEISIYGFPLQGDVTYELISRSIQFSALIYEYYYDPVTDNYSNKMYNLTSSEWNFNLYHPENVTYDNLDSFWISNKTEYVQGYIGSLVERYITVYVSYVNWNGWLSKEDFLKSLGVYMVGIIINNPVFSTNNVESPIQIQDQADNVFYLNSLFYSSVEIVIQK